MFDYRVSKHPHFDEACRVTTWQSWLSVQK
jgi:hypothetical protein